MIDVGSDEESRTRRYPVVGFSVTGPQWLVAMRGLPISRGKLYPGYRLFRRLRFVVGGNRRERSSNERVARPLDAPLVFARRRFIEILFLWPARARADARRGDVRERGERCERTTGRRRRESPLLLISSAFLPPSRTRAFHSISVLIVLPPRPPQPWCFTSSLATLRFSTLARARARSLAGISPGRDLAFSLRPALFALRPFNSIATPFYNAAAPCNANGSHDGF